MFFCVCGCNQPVLILALVFLQCFNDVGLSYRQSSLCSCLLTGRSSQSNQPISSVLHSTELGPENGGKSKKKRKERSKGVKHLEAGKEDGASQNETTDYNMDRNLPEREENQRPNSDK